VAHLIYDDISQAYEPGSLATGAEIEHQERALIPDHDVCYLHVSVATMIQQC
jgi:hypothetical protein